MTLFHSIPLSRIVISFSAGVILCSYLPLSLSNYAQSFTLVLALVTGSLILLRFFWRYTLTGFIIQIVFLIIGYILAGNELSLLSSSHFLTYNSDTLLLKISADKVEKSNSYKTTARVYGYHDIAGWKTCSGNVLIYLSKDSLLDPLSIGTMLKVPSSQLKPISPPANPHQFNYKRYLFHHDISHQVYLSTKSGIRYATDSTQSLLGLSIQLRNYLTTTIRSFQFSPRSEAVLMALLIGKKDYLDQELTQAYASAGAMHVLAVSGLHVGIVYLIVQFILSLLPLFNQNKWGKLLILMLVIWGYAFVTGLSPSVIRAATMFSFIELGTILNKRGNIYNALAASAFFILLVDPFMLMQVGFQLSYLAVLGIVYIQPKLAALWQPPRIFLIDKAWEISCVSVAAQLATAPLGFLYFHQFPSYFLISNLLVIPAAFGIVILGIACLVLHSIPIIGSLLVALLEKILDLLNTTMLMFKSFPYSTVSEIDISTLQTWFFYMILIAILYASKYRSKAALGVMMIILLILGGTLCIERTSLSKQQQLIIYQSRNASALDFISAQEHIFIADSSLIRNESAMLFQVKHHWWALNLMPANKDHEWLLQSGPYYVFHSDTLLHLTSSVTKDSLFPVSPSLLLVDLPFTFKHKQIKELCQNSFIILGNKLSRFQRRKWIEFLTQHHFHYHDLEMGAFVKQYD